MKRAFCVAVVDFCYSNVWVVAAVAFIMPSFGALLFGAGYPVLFVCALVVLLAVLGQSAGYSLLMVRRASSVRYQLLMLCAVVCVGVGLGATVGIRTPSQQPPTVAELPRLPVQATLVADSVVYRDFSIVSLTVYAQQLQRGIWTSTSYTQSCFVNQSVSLSRGQHVSAYLAITEIERGDGGGTATRRCTATAVVPLSGDLQVLPFTKTEQWYDGVAQRINTARQTAITSIANGFSYFPRPSEALLNALILGQRQQLHPYIVTSFRQSGSSHILALSGMHLAILLAIGYSVCGLVIPKRYATIIMMALAVLYLAIVGAKPSLERAVCMFLIWGGASVFNKKISVLNALGISCIVLVALRPTVLSDISFQLSYTALLGILIGSKPLDHRISRYMPPIASLPISASIAAQIFTLPIVLMTFGSWYPIGIVASLALTPLVTIFIWFHIGALVCSLLPFAIIDSVVSISSSVLYNMLTSVAIFFSRFPALELPL